jgi:hypothetical protein
MKKCAHPYPGDDSAHMRLATLDRIPLDAETHVQGHPDVNAPNREMPRGTARSGAERKRLKGNSDGY